MPRLAQFVSDLIKSGLVAPSAIDPEAREIADPESNDAARVLADRLVAAGHLTSYQSRKLLSGVTKGFIIGGYRILEPIGKGGSSKVYLAETIEDRRRVAIKVLPPQSGVDRSRLVDTFRREIAFSSRIKHGNVAAAIELGAASNILYIIMEYIPGSSLYDLVKIQPARPLSVADAAPIFQKIVDGVIAIHEAGIIHRDIKPSNIMITPEGDVRVLDLGLAISIEETGTTRSNDPDGLIGTADYVSPEQADNPRAVDARSDLYSLGCTFYFAISGRAPFDGGDALNKIYKHHLDLPEPLERLVGGVPAGLAALIAKLMAKRPADRYPSARAVAADLAYFAKPKTTKGLSARG